MLHTQTTQFAEIVKALSNQRRTDKSALGYYINHAESQSIKGLYWDSYKRFELLEYLIGLITTSPRSLVSLCEMQTFAQYKEWALNLPCTLVNSNGGKIMEGTYQECCERKNLYNDNRACYSITKHWTYKFSN